ncbi:MAG: 23S rRNA (guanosine(2251)-2'-O)-methyltransferase RlmB [Balneolaceae bacterium]
MELEEIYIYGRNPVEEQLTEDPGKVEKIFIRDGAGGSQLKRIRENASTHRIPVSNVPGNKLFQLLGKVNDQGIAALISPVRHISFDEWIAETDAGPETAILLLDQIEDPHNFGAILRSAAAAGISAVVIPKHNQAPVSAAVFKSSAGTAGRIPIVRTGNLNQTIRTLKEHKFWVAGLNPSAERSLWELETGYPVAFVIGSEGEGIRKKTGELCDLHYSIPMLNRVESLNASVSAALLCFEWNRRVFHSGNGRESSS